MIHQVMTNITVENHHRNSGFFPMNSMVIFHSYVKLPEGICYSSVLHFSSKSQFNLLFSGFNFKCIAFLQTAKGLSPFPCLTFSLSSMRLDLSMLTQLFSWNLEVMNIHWHHLPAVLMNYMNYPVATLW